MSLVIASKKSKFEGVLKRVHPAIARLARNVASRETSRTSMTDLAIRIATVLQRRVEEGAGSPEDAVRMVRDEIISIADWAAATGNEWRSMQTFDEMKQASEDWHRLISKKDAASYVTEDEVLMEFPDGWKIVEVDADNCKAEGALMGHCVGSYDHYVRSEEDRIFSLRDPKNRPHVTFNATIRGGDDDEYWSEDGEWESSMEYARDQRKEAWDDLVGPEARMDIRKQVASELWMRNPQTSDEEIDAEADKRIALAKEEYEAEWGPCTKTDEYSYHLVWQSDPDPYGSQSSIETVAEQDYEEKKAEYVEPVTEWHIEQVQGKEDNPPLNRYRPYLREFLNTTEYPTDEVEWRIMPVEEMLRNLEQRPGYIGSYLGDLREVDQGPIFDFLIQKILGGERKKFQNSYGLLLGYIKKRMEFGSATPEQLEVVKKLMEDRELVFIISSGIFRVIPGGKEWVIREVINEPSYSKFIQLVSMLNAAQIRFDAGTKAAILRRLELMMGSDEEGQYFHNSSLLRAYTDLLDPNEMIDRIETILEMENSIGQTHALLGEKTSNALAHIYQRDPRRWEELMRTVSPSLLKNLTKGGYMRRNLTEPQKHGLYWESDRNQNLEGLGEIDTPKISTELSQTRSNDLVNRIREEEERRGPTRPKQMQMELSASSRFKLIRLAQELEEADPFLSDRLESLLC